MSIQAIVLNGGSSSGTSSIARRLQQILPQPWLTLGVDTLIEALPASMTASSEGIEFAPDGQVHAGDAFRRFDVAWSAGVAAIVRAGAPVIIDDVFLGRAASQDRWRTALAGLEVFWVGVRCDAEVAAAREVERSGRVAGMARSQAELVHRGVTYDLTVDTTHATADQCALVIADAVRS